ncbi:hypothetical protein H0H92_012303 [Tricholoma furcatifolium]|nr:hypothetical protein H0H92_012303 [Tricholoma furcatifolium]
MGMWESLRATEGWAALQHHAVLRTTLTLYPPPSSLGNQSPPHLLVHLVQGSFFTILPADPGERRDFVPQWRAGNIYDMEQALPCAVDLPTPPNLRKPTVYEVFVSGDYEASPVNSNGVPVQTIQLSVELEASTQVLVHEPAQDIACDFVDGKAFGDAIGIAMRSVSGWWTVTGASVRNTEVIKLSAKRDTIIAPTQTRIVPFSIAQIDKFELSTLDVSLEVTSPEGGHETVDIKIPVKHRHRWNQTSYERIKATYFYGLDMPTAFLVVPPIHHTSGKTFPPILALLKNIQSTDGAGVDIFNQPFWTQSIPRNKHSWLVFPTGRTSWGLDWHGPSARDAWNTVDSLSTLLQGNAEWKGWEIDAHPRVILMGHSNGGQGAWYLASRYPDRVVGVIAAAAYLKSQAYVPWTMSRSAHYTDPALRAILDSSLTPDDNDLHLSNLVDVPILAIHGGNDSNVPPWHSREYISILKTLGAKNASIQEVAGEDHWYPSVFDNEQVQSFLEATLTEAASSICNPTNDFTLTVSDPRSNGALYGWKIEQLLIPGRLARLRVTFDNSGIVQVITSNVYTFSVNGCLSNCRTIQVDGFNIRLSSKRPDLTRFGMSNTSPPGWKVIESQVNPTTETPPVRLQDILSSNQAISFIVRDGINSGRELSVALRLANDLHTYHRIDSEIILESEVKQYLWELPSGNIVFIGQESSVFVRTILAERRTPFELRGAVLELNGRPLDDPNTGCIFLHPHPKKSTGLILFALAENHEALEQLARLFPIRTGVAAPSWIVTGLHASSMGTGGLRAAG